MRRPSFDERDGELQVTLSEATLRRFLRAAEADLVAHVSALYSPPFGEVLDDGDVVTFVTGGPSVYENGILRAPIEGLSSERVGSLMGPFRANALPMMWWFFTEDELPRKVLDMLGDAGLHLDSDRPAMGLDLTGWSGPGAADEGIEAVTPASFDAWRAVVAEAFDMPDYGRGRAADAFRERSFGPHPAFRHLIYVAGGKPLGAATLSTAAGVAGLANIAVVPHARRKGIGTALVRSVLAEARALGLTTAALTADEAGAALYERAGFVTAGRHRTFVWRPEAPA